GAAHEAPATETVGKPVFRCSFRANFSAAGGALSLCKGSDARNWEDATCWHWKTKRFWDSPVPAAAGQRRSRRFCARSQTTSWRDAKHGRCAAPERTRRAFAFWLPPTGRHAGGLTHWPTASIIAPAT